MKKVLALLLVTATLFLTACGGGDNSYVKGTLDGDTFSTEFMNMSFTIPSDNWVFATDEEISAMMGITMDEILDVNEFEKNAIDMLNVYDMMAHDAATGSSIMLIHENLAMSGNDDLNVEEYLDIVMEGIKSTQPDVPYVFEDYYTETVAGVEFTVLEASIEEIGLTQYYFSQKNGDFMSNFVISLFGDTTIEDILAQFDVA